VKDVDIKTIRLTFPKVSWLWKYIEDEYGRKNSEKVL
jgi:hypothetical protein